MLNDDETKTFWFSIFFLVFQLKLLLRTFEKNA